MESINNLQKNDRIIVMTCFDGPQPATILCNPKQGKGIKRSLLCDIDINGSNYGIEEVPITEIRAVYRNKGFVPILFDAKHF